MSVAYRMVPGQVVDVADFEDNHAERSIELGVGCFLLVVDEVRLRRIQRLVGTDTVSPELFVNEIFDMYCNVCEQSFGPEVSP